MVELFELSSPGRKLLAREALEGLLEVGHVICALGVMSPADGPEAVNGKGTTPLPDAAAAAGAAPDAVCGVEPVGRPQDRGAVGVPGAGGAEPPLGEEVALRVVDDLDVPGAADEGDPALRVCLGGLGYGDEFDVWVLL